MLQHDYLMRLIMDFVVAIRRVLEAPDRDPLASAAAIESAIGSAVELDADTVLRLEPDSFAGLLRASGSDPDAMGYVVHALALESEFLQEAGESAAADLRLRQAVALGREFGMDESSLIRGNPKDKFLYM